MTTFQVAALPEYRGPSAAYFAPPEPKHLTPADIELAQARVLADIEGFHEQLEITGSAYCTSEFELRVPGRLLQASDAVVLHALLTATDDDDIRAARDLLVQRYIKREDARVLRLANEYAQESES